VVNFFLFLILRALIWRSQQRALIRPSSQGWGGRVLWQINIL